MQKRLDKPLTIVHNEYVETVKE